MKLRVSRTEHDSTIALQELMDKVLRFTVDVGSRKIVFLGNLAPVMTAIEVHAKVIYIKIDIPRSEHKNAVGLQAQALIDVPLKFTVEAEHNPARLKAAKKERGPFGQYWFAMHKPDGYGASFATFPDLREHLGVDAPEQVHDALKARLEADSLTFVSPQTFEAFVRKNRLSEGLITLSKRCEVWAMEHAEAA